MPSDGTWNLDGLKLYETPSTQQKWAVVYPNRQVTRYCSSDTKLVFSRYNDVNDFVENFVSLSRVSGYDITAAPEYVELETDIHRLFIL